MCILFMYLNDKPEQCPYKLIVASNRDEYWDRPTEQAAFRGDRQQWIGGKCISFHTCLTRFPTALKIKTLILKSPITTAADDIHKYFFIVFQRK